LHRTIAIHADGRLSDAETVLEQTFDVKARDEVWIGEVVAGDGARVRALGTRDSE